MREELKVLQTLLHEVDYTEGEQQDKKTISRKVPPPIPSTTFLG